MYRRRYSPIGIDAGSAQIKMIQFRQNRGRIAVHCKALGPTDPEAYRDGMIVKPGPLIRELKRLKDTHRWHKNRVNLCLGPQAFYLRKVSLPQMTEAETCKAMFWEAENHFPLPASETVFDFCPADSEPLSGSEPRVYLLAATAKETADSFTAAVAAAGFQCVSLEILPLALLRSMQAGLQGRQEEGGTDLPGGGTLLRVLIDIGHRSSTILIIRGRKYHFYRNLKFGTAHFTEALLQSSGESYPAAHRSLYEKKTLEAKGLLEAAGHFATKLEQSLSYAFDVPGHTEPALRSLEFCGGGAFIPGLATFVEQKLAVKRRLYNPLSAVSGSTLVGQPEVYREEALYPAAHGLALRGWLK